MKLGICNEMFESRPIGEVFDFAASVGYDGVEIAPFTLAEAAGDVSAERRRQIVRQASDAGVEIVGLHWLLASPKGLHISHPDDAIRLKTRSYMLDLIDLCGDLGGKVMVFGSPAQRNIVEGESYEATWDRTVDSFNSCMDRAAERGVTICIEQLSVKETDFIRTPEEAAKLMDAVDHPNFKMMLDVKAISSLDRPIGETALEYGPRAAHVHANEADGNGPGTADADFASVFRALDEVGYDGYVSVEVFDFTPGAEKIARDSIAFLKQAQRQAVKQP